MSDLKTKFDFDLGLRHKSGMTSDEFIRRYCEVFRKHAFAKQDDSLNEFEKLITHVLNMNAYHQRRSALLGLSNDPREAVSSIEAAMNSVYHAKIKLAASLYTHRGDLPDYDALTTPEVKP